MKRGAPSLDHYLLGRLEVGLNLHLALPGREPAALCGRGLLLTISEARPTRETLGSICPACALHYAKSTGGIVKRTRPKVESKHELALVDQYADWCSRVSPSWPKPAREYRFHPTRLWRIDVAFVEQKIAVEVQGGFRRGAHFNVYGHDEDAEKSFHLAMLGWIEIRVSPLLIGSGLALRWIRAAMAHRLGADAAAIVVDERLKLPTAAERKAERDARKLARAAAR